MKRCPRLLSVFLAVLCLVVGAPAALGAADSSSGSQNAVSLGDHGLIERGRGPSGSGRWKGFPISLSLREASLPDVLRTFAHLAGFNLVLDPRVQGSVTAELKDVPWDQALSVILKTHGLDAEIDGRSWQVAPASALEVGRTLLTRPR
jgi:type IV pilus assembly protein PilQ